MLEYIRVKNIKGIKQCDLLGLGKINIICGKNNSGKSSILEGIENSDIGQRFTQNLIFEVYEESKLGMRWGVGESDLNREYLQVLQIIFSNKEVWYAEEIDLLITQYIQNYQKSNVSMFPLSTDSFKASFLSMFPKKPKPVLLPPKRNLESVVKIKTDEHISTSGSGILNFLFYAKNQAESSVEKGVLNLIQKAFIEISSGHKFDVFLEKDNRLKLFFSMQNENWINAGDCGIGLLDLLTILFFSIHPDYMLVLIEEPESHMHPDMQRKLLYFLKHNTLEDKQFFLSTHSNVFLNNSLVDKIIFTRYDGEVKIEDATNKAALLNEIGYSVADNLVSDLVILVEGPKDKPVIEEFLQKMELLGKYDIKIWPLGGDIMGQLDLSVMVQSYKIIGLIDSDPKSKAVRNKFIENCKQYNIPVHQLKRYAIENYYTIDSLRSVFGKQIEENIKTINPNKQLEEQIGINVKNNVSKLAKAMSLDDVKDTDFYDFLTQVKTLCEG